MTTSTKRLALIIGIVVLAGVFIWTWTHPRVGYAAAVARCREFYESAKTKLDTAKVDGTTPFERTNTADNPIRCGELRAARLVTR
jgi:hypothetical protein